jgi:D-sedoheptulose 7-phosphate isomerase
MERLLRELISESHKIHNELNVANAIKMVEKIYELKDNSNKLLFIGNGASNTIASHASLDYMNQTGILCICANDPAALTAYSNDFGYEKSFERFAKLSYKDGDILICISSSGNSENVIRAAGYVKQRGGCVISFTGFKKDNKLNEISDISFWVNSLKYNIVESIHNLWISLICDVLASRFPKVGTHGIIL